MNELTPKQTRFVAEYLRDLNATAAAVRAGYSERTANQQGPRLLENVDVAAAIDAAKAARSERTQIDADWVLKRLALEVDAKLSDLYDEKTGSLLPVHEWPDVWQQGLVAGVDTDEIFEGTGDDRRQIGETKKIRLSDRLRRLELIGKHVKVNAFQENVNHKSIDGLGDRLERAFRRLESDAELATKSRASAMPAPPDSGDAALQRTTDAARRYLEAENSFTPPDVEAAPARETRQEQTPQPTAERSPVENRYQPIWPQSPAFAGMGDDDEATAPYRNR